MVSLRQIKDLIKKQEKYGSSYLNLMPIENYLSTSAREALSCDCVNRYSLYNTPTRLRYGWYTLGEKPILELERKTELILKSLFDAKFLSSRPLSGIQAMEIILFAFAGERLKLFSIEKKNGGHSATTKIARRLGYKTEFIPFVDDEPPEINFSSLKKMISPNDKILIYLDLSCIIQKINLKKLRSILPKNALLCYDGSHVLGLIAGKCFQNPLKEGADLVCGSLHKSFFGPQRGVVMTNKPELWDKLKASVKTIVSNRHNNDLAALSLAAYEMKKFGKRYSKQILKNSMMLSQKLEERGFDVINPKSGLTETHQIWVKLPRNSKKYIETAFASKIILNRYPIPCSNNLGLRMGVQGITRLGMKEDDMRVIADILYLVKQNEVQISKRMTSKLINRFKKLKYC